MDKILHYIGGKLTPGTSARMCISPRTGRLPVT
jgi:hypothetical protein